MAQEINVWRVVQVSTGRAKLFNNEEKSCTTVKRGKEGTEAELEILVTILVSYYKATCRLPMGPGEASGEGNRLYN